MAAAVILRRFREPVTFGSADGLTVLLGLLVSLAGSPHALIRAATGASLAELVGMSAGAYLSDGDAGIWPALANGAAACAACLLPAVPYAAGGSGPGALATAIAVVVVVAGGISWLRPERGVLAVVQTYGILAAAAVLCTAAGMI